MAYSSSTIPSPPPPFFPKISPQQYDVFLSFRGEDTRYSFTSHLHAALSRLGVRTYIDYELERGDEISPSLLKAIEEAKVSVVVLSQNYASSKWCLEELVKIMECKRTNGQIIVPIFYHIEPTHVRNQTGSYADAFAEHDRRFMVSNMNKVLRWRLALAEVANLSGWDCLVTRYVSSFSKPRIFWEELNVTNQRILQQKQEKFLRTFNRKDMEDLNATQQHIAQIEREQENRRRGLFRGI